MASYPWFRYYSETIKDKKIDLIAEESDLGFLSTIGAWSLLLCMANDSPIRGSLYVTLQKRYTNEYIIKTLRLSKEDGEKLINLFIDYDMIDIDENQAYRVKNWDKRQFKSDFSNERVNKYRLKKKEEEQENEESNGGETLHVTFHSVSASASESESISESINDLEGINQFTREEVSEERDLVTIYMNVTGNMGLPVKSADRKALIESLGEIYFNKKDQTTDYLRPFFKAWVDHNYSKTNFGWLDWAMAGEIKGKKDSPKEEKSASQKRLEKLMGTSEIESSDPLIKYKNSIDNGYFKNLNNRSADNEGLNDGS
jgi:hypothetical protein